MAEAWSRVMPGIAADKSLSKTALRVAIALGKYVDEFWFCFPSQDQIAADCNMARQTAWRGIKELSDRGWLTITPARNARGRFLHNTYSFRLPPDYHVTHGGDTVDPESHSPCNENAPSMSPTGVTHHVTHGGDANCPLELPIIKQPIAENDFFEGKERQSLIGSGKLLAKHLEESKGLGSKAAWVIASRTAYHVLEAMEQDLEAGKPMDEWQQRIDAMVKDERKPKPKGGPHYATGFQP